MFESRLQCWRLAVLAIALSLLVTGCGWPMLDFGPARTGYNPFETAIDANNVGQLREAWTTTNGNGSPVVAGGRVFVVDSGDQLENQLGYVRAFDAEGKRNCSGDPKICAPLWTATFPGFGATAPAVENGVVYVDTQYGLLAFDAAGVAGCSGLPTTCTPLWTGIATGLDLATPLVSNGVVYAGSTGGTLYAFDAAGSKNCARTNTPTTCAPLWTATTTDAIYAPPATANGVLYVGTLDDTASLYAFDADGVTNCSGSPKRCTPLWRGNRAIGSGPTRSAPAVADGKVFVGDTSMTAFDAAGTKNCSGTPKICSPLWDTPSLNAEFNGPAVAKGIVYGTYHAGALYTLDAEGLAGCSGTPTACNPLWSAKLGAGSASSASIANGVVYATGDTTLYSFDAEGIRGCSGSPKTCTPLWTGSGSNLYSPAISNGVVYASDGTRVHAYTVP